MLNNLCEYPHIFKDQKVLNPQTLDYKGSKLGLSNKKSSKFTVSKDYSTRYNLHTIDQMKNASATSIRSPS